jgi:hypothetical protein
VLPGAVHVGQPEPRDVVKEVRDFVVAPAGPVVRDACRQTVDVVKADLMLLSEDAPARRPALK